MFAMFAASPSPTMGEAFGRLHKGERVAFGGAPTFVESIVGDGEAANIGNTYAYTYEMCLYFYILLIYWICIPYTTLYSFIYSYISLYILI